MPTKTARKGPVSGAGRKVGKRVSGNAKRKWRRTLRRHPSVGVLASVLLAVLAVALLAVGLLAENVLYFLAMGLSALGSVAITRARHLEAERQQRQRANRPTVADHPKVRPHPSQGEEASPSSAAAPGVVKCTDTGKAIADCGCSSRHVATAEGVKRYGLPLGSPMGRRAKTSKPSATTRGGG